MARCPYRLSVAVGSIAALLFASCGGSKPDTPTTYGGGAATTSAAVANTNATEPTTTAPPSSTLDDLPGTFSAALVDVAAGTTADVTPTERTTITTVVGWGIVVELDVPAAAVEHDTAISVQPVSIGGYLGVRLEPEGLLLNQPATLRFIPTSSAERDSGSSGDTPTATTSAGGAARNRHSRMRGYGGRRSAASISDLHVPVYARDGWDEDGTERFAPRWRTADQDLAIYRLRPVVAITPFPSYEAFRASITPPPTGPTTTFASILTTIAPTTTTTIAVPEVPAEAPVLTWEHDVAPALTDPATESSNVADRAAWLLEHGADAGAASDGGARSGSDNSGDPNNTDDKSIQQINGSGENRFGYLSGKCSDKTSKPRDSEELYNLLNNVKKEIDTLGSLDGCLVLAWQVSAAAAADVTINGESISIDQRQQARGQAVLDDGSGTSEAPIFGHANGLGAGLSLLGSGLGKVGAEIAGVDDPYAISAKYCPDSPDEQSGVMQVQIEPLPDHKLRLRILPKPGDFAGCGPMFRVDSNLWQLINLMRGEAEGTPIVLTMPVRPDVSRNIGFLETIDGAKVKLTEGKAAEITVKSGTWSVDFQVLLAFAPIR